MDDHVRIQRQRERPAVVRLWRALQPLKSVLTFMNTGAHPDDETSAMLAALALRDGVRTVFACSTRGEGGQNALGTEAGHDLGALRTREMEVAAEAIGLGVCWLSESAADPITDFGFSKHADEALRVWGEERTVERLVRAIRRERPDIVCPTFLDVRGQHGHHRAMTQAAHRAVVLAADPSAFPSHFEEGLAPWRVSKLYLPAWSGAGQSYDDALPPPNATVVVDTGGHDPVLGATYAQIAQWSRAGHKTQGMGKWLDAGDDSRPLHLAWSGLGATSEEASIAEGLPRSLLDLAPMSDDAALREAFGAADREIAAALQAWPDAATVGEAAARALTALRAALALAPDPIRHRLTQKEAQLARVMFEASGPAVRATVTPAIATPGSRVRIDVHLDMRDMHLDGAPRLSLGAPENWSAIPLDIAASRRHEAFDVEVAADTPLSDGYQDHFRPGGGNGLVYLVATFAIGGVEASHAIDLEEPLLIAPPVDVRAEPAAAILNASGPQSPLRVRVSARLLASGVAGVTIEPETEAGWQCEPASVALGFTGADSAADIAISTATGPGLYRVGTQSGRPPCTDGHADGLRAHRTCGS